MQWPAPDQTVRAHLDIGSCTCTERCDRLCGRRALRLAMAGVLHTVTPASAPLPTTFTAGRSGWPLARWHAWQRGEKTWTFTVHSRRVGGQRRNRCPRGKALASREGETRGVQGLWSVRETLLVGRLVHRSMYEYSYRFLCPGLGAKPPNVEFGIIALEATTRKR